MGIKAPHNTISRFFAKHLSQGFLLSLLLLISVESDAQRLIVQKTFTTKDGLPSNTVHSILQDSKKYLWFATQSGVARYDGKEFKVYTMDDGLGDNEIFQCYEDSQHRIWFKTWNGVPCFYDINQDKIFNPTNAPYLKDFQVPYHFGRFCEDKDGRIWHIGGNMYTIQSLDKNNKVSLFPDASPGEILLETIKLPNGTVVFTTRDYLLYENEQKQLARIPSGSRFAKDIPIFDAPNGIYYCSKAGIRLWNPMQFDTLVIPASIYGNKPISFLSKGPSGNIYVGLYNEVLTFSPNGQSFLSWVGGNTNHIIEDHEGNIWITTLDEGIKFVPACYDKMEQFNARTHYKTDVVTCLALDGSNRLVATENGWLNVHLPTGIARLQFVYKSPIAINRMNMVGNHLWLMTNAGIVILNDYRSLLKKPDTVINLENTTYSSTIFKFDQSQSVTFIPLNTKEILISSVKNIIYLSRTTSISKVDITDSKTKEEIVLIHNGRVYAMEEDRKGRIWYGGLTNVGLGCYDPATGTNQTFRPPVLGTMIDMVFLGERYLLIATMGEGLFLIDIEKPQQILVQWSTADGMPSSICNRLCKESNRRVWGATNRGVFSLVFEDTLTFQQSKMRTYGQAFGLQSALATDVKMQGQALLVGTASGLIVFQPDNAVISRKHPILNGIKFVFRDTSMMLGQDKLHIAPHNDQIIVQLQSVLYQNSERVKYRIHLFRKKQWKFWNAWLEPQQALIKSQALEAREFNINSLQAGCYLLSIEYKLEGIDNGWTFLNSVSFIKDFPWYLSLPMMLIYLLTAFISIVAFVQWRTNRLLSFQRERLELENKAFRAQMNPHFINNSLTAVQSFFVQGDLERGSEYVLDLSELIRATFNMSQRERIPLKDEVHFLEEYIKIERIRLDSMFQFTLDCPAELLADNPFIPPMMIQPVLENALKYGISTKCTQNAIVLCIRQTMDGFILCSVEDNGKGIDMTKKHRPQGYDRKGKFSALEILEKRLSYLRTANGKPGVLKIMDKKQMDANQTGTMVEIWIPLGE